MYIPSPFLPSPILRHCHIQQPSRASCLLSLFFTFEAFPWSHSSHTYPVVFPFRNRSQLRTALPLGSGSDMPKLTSHQQRFSRIVPPFVTITLYFPFNIRTIRILKRESIGWSLVCDAYIPTLPYPSSCSLISSRIFVSHAPAFVRTPAPPASQAGLSWLSPVDKTLLWEEGPH